MNEQTEGNKMTGEPAEVRMIVEVTRADTGKTETVELVGTLINEEGAE